MKRDDENNRYDRISSISKTALAVGAGAVFLYGNGGGRKFLSRDLPKTLKAMDAGKESFKKASYLSTRGQGKQFLKRTKDEMIDAAKTVNKMDIRRNSRDSFFSVIQERANLGTNKTKIAQKMHWEENIVGALKEELGSHEALKNIEKNRINTIIDDAVTHLTDTVAYEDDNGIKFSKGFMQKVHGVVGIKEGQDPTEEALKQVDVITNAIKEKLDDREANQSFLASREAVVDDIMDKLYNFDEIERKYGSSRAPKKGSDFIDSILGDRAATINEILERKQEFKNRSIPGTDMKFFDELQRLVEEDARWGDITPDATIRIKDNQVYSNAQAFELYDKMQERFLHTTPGKLIKPLEHSVYQKQSPLTYYTARGSVDYILPKVAEGKTSNMVDNSYYRILDKTYRIKGDNTLEHVQALDDYVMTSGEHGSTVRLLKNITGDVDRKTPNTEIGKWLGLGSSPKENKLQEFKGWLGRKDNENYIPNIFKRIRQSVSEIDSITDENERAEKISEFVQDFRKVNGLFKKTSAALDGKTAYNISKNMSNSSAKRIMELSSLSNSELLEQLQTDKLLKSGLFGDGINRNADLTSLLEKLHGNAARAMNMKSISSVNKDGFKITQVENLADMIKREMNKEAFLREGGGHVDFDASKLLNVINGSDISATKARDAKQLAQWATIQERAGIFSSSAKAVNKSSLEDIYKDVKDYFSDSPTQENFVAEFRRTAEDIITSKSPKDIPATQADLNEISKANRSNQQIYVRKGINAIDVLKDLNDETKMKAYAKQFIAGRNDMENVTTATLVPYFSLFRLSDALAATGLSLGPADTGSVIDLAKNITLKRVLPAMGVMAAWDYLNYESENITGTSVKGAAANAVANFSLGVRGGLDTIGMDKYFKSAWYGNPYMQYLFEDPYRDKKEQREWYQEGYTPVRKGRWWSFGSASEFRGGKVDYWQPNYVRRANTAWEDIGTYGSSEERWKHSLIPTLRHPFSPIRYLMNPYWLEEKNKYSRPYPLTGKMFGEGTPFSGILNATVGNIIKPQININSSITGRNFVDVRDLIAQRNEYVKYKASRKQLQPLTIEGSNTLSEGGGEVFIPPALRNNSSFEIAQLSLEENRQPEEKQFVPVGSSKVTILDKLFVSTISSNVGLSHISDLNKQTKQRVSKTGYVKSIDAMSAVDTLDMLNDKDFVTDLKSMKGLKDNLIDVAYSAKQLGGIYGFIFDEIMPTQKRYGLASANSMNSFSRRFWDDSIGGTGGELMEIARRFFPHENHDIERINPIRNNMPDWMPDRFKHGDPYTQVKKGEMRMPGAAYESINHLNIQPDFSIHPYMIGASKQELYNYFLNKSDMDQQFNAMPNVALDVSQSKIDSTLKNARAVSRQITKGIEKGIINKGEFYSDLDKFKILADVAPWSQEYKDMRAKMRASGNSKEVDEILARVEKQNQGHQFFNYQYRGVDFKTQDVVIDQITNNGFTIVGSDKTFTMAGVKVDAETLAAKIQSGMRVNIEYDKLDAEEDNIKVIVNSGFTNINRELFKEDSEAVHESAIDSRALSTPMQRLFGSAFETVGHLPIPYLHSKFMKMETPLEAYKNENVYGTPFSTWSNPIKSMLMPSIQKGWGASGLHATLGIAAWAASEYMEVTKIDNKLLKKSADVAFGMITPGAFTGAMASFIPTLGKNHIRTGARIGAAAWAAGYAYHHADNPFLATAVGSAVGAIADDWYSGNGKRGGAIGAAIGLAISAYKTDGFHYSKLGEKYIPETTQRRWEIEEYYDRLKYIKYKGLFERASELARKKEGVNIKYIIKDMERQEEELDKQKEKALKAKERLVSSNLQNSEYGRKLMQKLDNILYSKPEEKIIRGGEYTKSAIAYKQAMDSTIFGLDEDASWGQILRALPKNDRDFFIEFGKERDPERQKEILKHVSPYKQNILKNMWGIKTDKLESNASYFKSHELPNMTWDGWTPQKDLDHYQIKTIQNEGLLLSDFGYYESALDEQGVAETGILHHNEPNSTLGLQKNLITALNGIGLIGVDVSVTQVEKPGISILANIGKITNYQVKESINNALGRAYYY